MTTTERTEPETLAWGDGDPIAGTPFRELVSTDATGGRLVVLSAEMALGEAVAEHVHDAEDQITVVVSGEVGATVGDRQVHLAEGAVLRGGTGA